MDAHVEIAGERLPLYYELPPSFDRAVAIPLPHHRATYHPGAPRGGRSGDSSPSGRLDDSSSSPSAIAARVLAEEGLTLHDLKARILKKAYLPGGNRALLLFPQDPSASPSEPDDRFPGQHKLTLTFTLRRGSYATLVIKALSL